MLLMVEKGIRGRICHALHTDTKANNKYMTNYAKNIDCNSVECNSSESSYLIYLDMNNLHGQTMSKKLPVSGFEWEENICKFMKTSSKLR